MPAPDLLLPGLSVALGLGLLIGAERERRKGDGPSRAAAGLRSFAIASVAGAVAASVGGEVLVATVTAAVAALATVAYRQAREEDPGLTTELALVLTALLGAFAMREPTTAMGLGVLVAGLLHARSPLHGFVRSILSEEDVRDALVFAGAALVVLPLLPDRTMGPWQAVNPYATWMIVVLVMSAGAIGYVMTRIAGARFGLPLAGLASGFISSVATIGAMGERARRTPEAMRSLAAGAILSTVATIAQMAVVLGATSMAVLEAMLLPLLLAGAVAVAYGAIFTLRAVKQAAGEAYPADRAFSLKKAVAFGMTVAVILFAAAAMQAWLGTTGAILAAAIAGFADTHAAAVSIASLAAAGRIDPASTVVPILAAFTTNTLAKVVFAATAGGRAFAAAVIPGLLLVALAAWLGCVAQGRLSPAFS